MLLSGARFSDHKAESAMVKRITKYVNGYMDRLKDGMPAPSNGDCWYCLFVTKDGKPLGDISNNSHLSDHMRERYYVPSLLINALVEKGYKYPALIAGMRDDKTMGGRGLEHSCRIALRQYLKRRLMPTANGSKPV